jgi:DNA invertase Pin-like site-specific DNA recombinase
MNERTKITASHLARQAIVYLRQSSAAQVEHNRESTDRQYALASKARALGWPAERVVVIDEDLGLSGSGAVARSGFARLTAEVALAHVGLVLGLEVSRLARNNAEWYRLIDLAGLTDTLIGDADGLYHPALFNDRLLLGLKGTMSEAELHVLRARLDGGIRNKAARGELRRGLPVGFVWGEADGEVCFHPDEAVVTAIRTVFERFSETGSARRVWLWLRSEGLKFPLRMHQGDEIRWVEASYTAIHHVLTNPVTPAPTPMARPAEKRSWTPPAGARSACDACPAPSGKCSSLTIIRASSTGSAMKQTRNESPATPGPDRTKRVAP